MGNQLKQRKVAEACDQKYKQKTKTKINPTRHQYKPKTKKLSTNKQQRQRRKHPETTAGLEKAQPKLRGAPGLTPTHPAKTSQRTHGTEGSPTEMTKRTWCEGTCN